MRMSNKGLDCGVGTKKKHRVLERVTVREGYFRFTDSSTDVYRCGAYTDYSTHCGGGRKPNEGSCLHNSKGPLCSQCIDNFFHSNSDDGVCVECGESSVARSMIPVIILLVLAVTFVVWLQLEQSTRFRRKLSRWFTKHWAALSWWAVSARIIFFDYQIITKFSYMQEVI